MLENKRGIKIKLIRFEEQKKIRVDDIVAREAKLNIIVNKKKIVTLNCSPGNDKYLGIGFLLTTSMIRNKEELISMKLKKNSIHIEIESLTLSMNERNNSNLMIGIQEQIEEQIKETPVIRASPEISLTTIYHLVLEMQEKATFFKLSGGVHSCALATAEGTIVLFCEDISRYNTIDCIVGEAFLKSIKTDNKAMITSCRITSGIIKKMIVGNIPIIISRAAPTDFAIQLAKQKGITLVGFVRGKRMNIYSHPERIVS